MDRILAILEFLLVPLHGTPEHGSVFWVITACLVWCALTVLAIVWAVRLLA